MATKEQYEFFKFLFDEEWKRYSNLIDRGKAFISLMTIYSGFIIFSATNAPSSSLLLWTVFIVSVTAMLCAFLLSILAIGIYKHESANSPQRIIRSFGDEPPSNEDFFDDRIADLAVSCVRNAKVNERRAKFLFWASVCFFIGLTSHACYFIIRLSPVEGALKW